MFDATVTIPQQEYGYVEKINLVYKYDDILRKLLKNSSNNNIDFVNNNIMGDNYIMNSKEYVKPFTELYDVAHDKLIKLSKKIDFIITSDEDGFYYTNKNYNIYVYGETQKEAESLLYEELKFQFDNYALEEDEKLDTNAKRLKNNLLSLFGANAKI
ncbi:MAG: hypothetical protein ACI4WP_01040 [Bacilli bacterium]